ncbi:glutathione S-transferase N-terminal domain-containing protein [Sphingomonas sp.]|uniref:glutathione S-transferase N-terminal domain-containing protein n=1 Tax=Sphingomonas sp. TaxID=28214 RepID=UPI000DB59F12|nr:glutathione S-transferase N-terminal domain-containing protein [Sphingomonas sp.]PZU09093.1 MAG: glutathione S-transferase [Sphingomonas sp.]
MTSGLIVLNWPTPNGRKVFIMLEELGVSYETRFVNIDRNEQFDPQFLAVSPNNKIPALIDAEAEGAPIQIFESGAILIYLAEKYGRFLARSGQARAAAQAWSFWQVGGLGPMMGQVGFFAFYAKERVPLAIERYTGEVGRLLGVLETRLAKAPYLAGDAYSIADMCIYPWVVGAYTRAKEVLAAQIADKPAISRWLEAVGSRPAVMRAMAIEPTDGITH